VFWVWEHILISYSFVFVTCIFVCIILYTLSVQGKTAVGNNGPLVELHHCAIVRRPICDVAVPRPSGECAAARWASHRAHCECPSASRFFWSPHMCHLRCLQSLHVAVVALIYTNDYCCCWFSIHTILSLWILFLYQHGSLQHQIMIDKHGTDTTCFEGNFHSVPFASLIQLSPITI
jgi:hypothetical protein